MCIRDRGWPDRWSNCLPERCSSSGRIPSCRSCPPASSRPPSHSPVSYTHLDVYKRQGFGIVTSATPGAGGFGRNNHANMDATAKNLLNLQRAVSYTHLAAARYKHDVSDYQYGSGNID